MRIEVTPSTEKHTVRTRDFEQGGLYVPVDAIDEEFYIGVNGEYFIQVSSEDGKLYVGRHGKADASTEFVRATGKKLSLVFEG